MRISDDDLLRLEADVGVALARGDAGGLGMLGHGEISLVLGWPAEQPRWACKRLPPFGSTAAAQRYEALFARYVDRLRERGVQVVDTDVRPLEVPGPGTVVYCVQPVLAASTLATEVVRTDPSRARAVLGGVVDHVLAVVDRQVGLDAQLSNWAVGDAGLSYLDLTTPMLRTSDGRSELDTDVFLASLPWILRPAVRRLVIPDVLDRYHDARAALLDLAANLVKERLDDHIPTVVELAGDRVSPRLTEDEARADYRSDARTWAALQRVRRIDRAWQRKVRRRTYPFLLPGPIDR